MEILQYVARGYSNKEIATDLNISRQTVKNHMTAILRKLTVDDRTQAALYALLIIIPVVFFDFRAAEARRPEIFGYGGIIDADRAGEPGPVCLPEDDSGLGGDDDEEEE